MKRNDEEKLIEEGPRSFARFLEQVADGQAQLDLSDELYRLCLRLREEALAQTSAVTGELDLKLTIRVEPTGIVAIAYGIKRKEPAPKRPGSIMWLTEGGNLTPQNPRQQTLPLVDVKAERVKAELEAWEGNERKARNV